MSNEKISLYLTDFTTYDNSSDKGRENFEKVSEKLEPISDKREFLQKFFKDVQDKITKDQIHINRTNGNKADSEKYKINDPFSKGEQLNTGNIVGIYRDKKFKPDENEDTSYEVILQIGSRFDAERKFFLLQAMLEKAVPDLKFSNNEVFSDFENVFRFLYICIFKRQLSETWRLGMYRMYQRFEKNDDRVKGSIDVARHIRLNMGLKNGKIAYSYRERTADNPFNHLLLYTYETLKREFPDLVEAAVGRDFEVRAIIEELRREAPSYRDHSISTIVNRNAAPITHPFYHPYEELRKTCLDILRGCGLSVFEENGPEVEGILFYVPDLWECFVEDILQKSINKVGKSEIQLNAQEENKFLIEIENNQGKNAKSNMPKKARPDYVFRDETKKAFFVLDAKYRDWEGRDKYNGPDIDKCIRDMRVVNVHATGVVYPVKNGETVLIRQYQLSEKNKEDNFYEIGIGIPKIEENQAYEAWKSMLSEKNNLEEIGKVIEATREKEAEWREAYAMARKLMNNRKNESGNKAN